MSEPKNKKKKPDLLVTILSIALIAFVIVFIIMAVQYYKLTNSLMEVRQIQQTEQVGMETGESETSTEDVVSGVDTEENTKKETKEETIRTTENGTEKQTVTETVAESGSETESETAEPEISTPETESETEQPVVIQTETSQPETQSVPVVHQASELTIQDIPNSLYARLQICLCHGRAGNEIILKICEQKNWGNKQVKEEMIHLIEEVVEVLEERRECNVEERFHPGLMNGITGVGMMLINSEESFLSLNL